MGDASATQVQTVKVPDIPEYRTWLACHPGTHVVSVTMVEEADDRFLLVAYVPPQPRAAEPCACDRRRGSRLVELRVRRRTLGSMRNPA